GGATEGRRGGGGRHRGASSRRREDPSSRRADAAQRRRDALEATPRVALAAAPRPGFDPNQVAFEIKLSRFLQSFPMNPRYVAPYRYAPGGPYGFEWRSRRRYHFAVSADVRQK